jgi:glycosyltransferase involved in cell wall biosynthesis
LSLLLRLARELRAVRPDVVQGWMYHGNLAAWGARILLRAKWRLFWSVRCSIGEPASVKLTTRITRDVCAWLSGPVTCIIYNSQLARRQHEEIGYPADKGVVIPNGFDTERFRPNANARAAFRRRYSISDGQAVVGHIARVQPMKDHPNLLLAALKVTAQAQNTIFVLAGPRMTRLADGREAAAAIDALGDKVMLLPEQENVNELMVAFDVFVLSSAFGEGFPNVLGEAQSCGTPCVATDVGDCAVVIGETGIIVPPRNPDMLASAMLKLLRMPAHEREQLGLRARARMQQSYSLANIAAMYAASWLDAESAGEQGSPCAA